MNESIRNYCPKIEDILKAIREGGKIIYTDYPKGIGQLIINEVMRKNNKETIDIHQHTTNTNK